jgi:hypothetical protein
MQCAGDSDFQNRNVFLGMRLKCKGKIVPVLSTEHHDMKTYWRSGGIAPHILDLGTRWR